MLTLTDQNGRQFAFAGAAEQLLTGLLDKNAQLNNALREKVLSAMLEADNKRLQGLTEIATATGEEALKRGYGGGQKIGWLAKERWKEAVKNRYDREMELLQALLAETTEVPSAATHPAAAAGYAAAHRCYIK